MARIKENELEELKSSEEVTKEVDGDNEAVVNVGVKKVKIHTLEDIDSMIACQPIRIAKDKDCSVPSDVAAILCNSKKAYRV